MTITHLKSAPLADELKRRGYTVTAPSALEWTTLAALAKKCGVLPSSLHRTLSRNPNAPGIQYDRNPRTGRTRALSATPAFFEWFQKRPCK